MSKKQRILLFGGTFNPIHNAHLAISRSAADQLDIDRLIFIPSAKPPHKLGIDVASFGDRRSMCNIATFEDESCRVCDCEFFRDGPRFTIDTVNHMRFVFRVEDEIFWLIGADTIKELPSWHKINELASICTFVTACRSDHSSTDLSPLDPILSSDQIDVIKNNMVDTPSLDISSTYIRECVSKDLPIDHLVPPDVDVYIKSNFLYREESC
jgi:nicotinate-nucleotide adenylyltransferase